MGYTHYLYYDPAKITDESWKIFTEKLLLVIKTAIQKGIHIDYEYDKQRFWFNGSTQQPKNKRVHEGGKALQRPDNTVSLSLDNIGGVTGEWFAGTQLNFPSVPLDGNKDVVDASYEDMVFSREKSSYQPISQPPGVSFSCCKTNYYPYDCVVTASILLMKHLVPEYVVKFDTDGEQKDWVL